MGLWDFRHLLFFYAFVNIAIHFFDTDLSLRFSVIEVKQKEVNGSILVEKVITHRKGPFNDFKYMKNHVYVDCGLRNDYITASTRTKCVIH